MNFEESFTTLNLPLAVHAQASKLLNAISIARSQIDLLSAADRAEGFVLGLETVKALNPASIEGLYLAFDNAATMQRQKYEK